MNYKYHISEYPAEIKERIKEVEQFEAGLRIIEESIEELRGIARGLRVNDLCPGESRSILYNLEETATQLDREYERVFREYQQVFSEVYPLVRSEDIRRMIAEDEAFIRGKAS